jgi:hypothetical protein
MCYCRVFTKHPDYQILFTRTGFGDTPLTQLDNNPAFGEHIIKVMRAFDYVIRNLGKPKTLLAYLKNVGGDHIARNVERRHFQVGINFSYYSEKNTLILGSFVC